MMLLLLLLITELLLLLDTFELLLLPLLVDVATGVEDEDEPHVEAAVPTPTQYA